MLTDTHAHAFPDLDFLARELPDNLRTPLTATTAAIGTAFGTLQRAVTGGSPLLDVEKLARFRRQGPRLLHQASEMGLGLAMLPQMLLRAGLTDLEESMERHGIDRTVVIASWPAAPNEWLLAETPRYRGRIVPVCHPPRLGPDAAQDDWEAGFDTLAERGARGFKIHHNMDGMPLEAPAYRAMFEVAQARDLFVIIHTGQFTVLGYKHLRAVHPEQFETYFRDYPEVRVCLAHMNRDDPAAAWAVMRRHDNLYTDTSWQPADSVRAAIAEVGAERILLGSDWPLLHGDLQGDCRAIVERAATGQEYQTITTDAAATFLGATPD